MTNYRFSIPNSQFLLHSALCALRFLPIRVIRVIRGPSPFICLHLYKSAASSPRAPVPIPIPHPGNVGLRPDRPVISEFSEVFGLKSNPREYPGAAGPRALEVLAFFPLASAGHLGRSATRRSPSPVRSCKCDCQEAGNLLGFKRHQVKPSPDVRCATKTRISDQAKRPATWSGGNQSQLALMPS